MTLCAGLAWHFHEINSVLEFRSAGFATPRVTAGEIIYDVLRYLARVTPLKPPAGISFLDSLERCVRYFQDRPDQPAARLDSHRSVEFLVFSFYVFAIDCSSQNFRSNSRCAKMRPVSVLKISAPEISRFRQRLLSWFTRRKRDLPWRQTQGPLRDLDFGNHAAADASRRGDSLL